MRPSTSEKSKLPSLGSISSQLSGVTTELRPMALSLGQIGFMYSRFDEEELCSSPESIRKGLPSTINWVAAPRFSRWGAALVCAESMAVSRPRNKSRIGNVRSWFLMATGSLAQRNRAEMDSFLFLFGPRFQFRPFAAASSHFAFVLMLVPAVVLKSGRPLRRSRMPPLVRSGHCCARPGEASVLRLRVSCVSHRLPDTSFQRGGRADGTD